MRKLIARFKAVVAQAISAENVATQVVFGAAAVGFFNFFTMAATGAMTLVGNVGKVTIEAVLNVGGVDGTTTGVFMARMLLNGTQVGELVSVTVVGTGETRKLVVEHTFDSLSGDDEITIEMALDAAGTAATGGTVMTAATSGLAAWGTAVPAELNVYG